MAKSFLESEGIEAILIDESTIATDWMLAGAIGGIKLQVPPLQLERAEMLLTQIDTDKGDAPPEVLPHPAQTPLVQKEIAEDLQSEREDRAPINLHVDRLYRATVFGLIFWPLQAYALFLLVLLLTEDGTVSADRRWKVWLSVLLNLPILAVVFISLSCMYGFFTSH